MYTRIENYYDDRFITLETTIGLESGVQITCDHFSNCGHLHVANAAKMLCPKVTKIAKVYCI